MRVHEIPDEQNNLKVTYLGHLTISLVMRIVYTIQSQEVDTSSKFRVS